eukprot:3329828-Amphidinium_carterae.1
MSGPVERWTVLEAAKFPDVLGRYSFGPRSCTLEQGVNTDFEVYGSCSCSHSFGPWSRPAKQQSEYRNDATTNLWCAGGTMARADRNQHNPRLGICLCDGTEQRLNNRRQLAIMEQDHYDNEDDDNIPFVRFRPGPVDWLAHEDIWSRTWFIHETLRVAQYIRWALWHLLEWRQVNRTPPIVHGGAHSTMHRGQATRTTLFQTGGAKGPASSKSPMADVPDTISRDTSSSRRPYPFGPAFANVLAFPPASMSRFIETTASYFASPCGEEMCRRVSAKAEQENNLDTYSFITPGGTYFEYYRACLQFYASIRESNVVDLTTGKAQGTQSSSSSAASAVAGVKRPSTEGAPSAKMAKTSASTATSSTQAAFQAVQRRRQAPGYDGPDPAAGGAPTPSPMGPPPVPQRRRNAVALRGSVQTSATKAMATAQAVKPIAVPPATTQTYPSTPSALPANNRPPLRRALAKPPPPKSVASDAEHIPQRAMPKPRIVLKERSVVTEQEGAGQEMVRKAVTAKPPVRGPAMPAAPVQADSDERSFHNPWFLTESYGCGTFKIPAPRVPGLAELVRTTVTPLAALLKVRVSLVSWRGQEDQVRVHYIASTHQHLPLVDATIDGFALLRQVCEDVATRCPFLYIEFRVRAEGIDDIMNFWTPTGRTSQTATMAVLHGAIRHVFANSHLICPTATVLLPEAHHLIIFARPLTHHSMHDRYVDARDHLMAYLGRNPVRADSREWSFVVDFVHGAGHQRPLFAFRHSTQSDLFCVFCDFLQTFNLAVDLLNDVNVVKSVQSPDVVIPCNEFMIWCLGKTFATRLFLSLAYTMVDLSRDAYIEWHTGGAGHVGAFHAALKAGIEACPLPQDLVSSIESSLEKLASGETNSDSPPLLLDAVARADRHLGSWARWSLLHRDFVRGSFLDLVVLSDLFDVGIT